MTDLFGEVIFSYSRAQAIDDGVLVDVSELAREAGFVLPVAMTRGAWADLVEWDTTNGALQDETARLWDVLTVLLATIRGSGRGTDRVDCQVLRIPNKPGATRALTADFYSVCGPG